MVSLSQITVGGLTSFMVYAAWVGISVGGEMFRTAFFYVIEFECLYTEQVLVFIKAGRVFIDSNHELSFAQPTRSN